MLITNDGMPGFISTLPVKINNETLIVILAMFAMAAYVFYLFSGKIIDQITSVSTTRLEKRNLKLDLFEGQQELVKIAYTRYIDIIAKIAFCVLGIAIILVIYPEIAFTILAFVVSCYVFYAFLWNAYQQKNESIHLQLQKQLSILSNLGFFLVFVVVILDYIFFTINISLFLMLISIILSRQVLSSATGVVSGVIFLDTQQQKLNTLLFHSQVFDETTISRNPLWDFLNPDSQQHKELKMCLETLIGDTTQAINFSWHDSGLVNIFFLTVEPNNNGGKRLLIKIYGDRRSADARNEETLLVEFGGYLPAPPLLQTTRISGFHVHVFDITGYDLKQASRTDEGQFLIFDALSKIQLTPKFISRYRRSRKIIWDRIDRKMLEQLELVANDKHLLENFRNKLPLIKKSLRKLPLRLTVDRINNLNLIAKNPEDSVHFLHWGQWSIEPMGVGWPEQFLNKSDKPNNSSIDTSEIDNATSTYVECVLLANTCSQLEKAFITQKYDEAMSSIETILNLVSKNEL